VTPEATTPEAPIAEAPGAEALIPDAGQDDAALGTGTLPAQIVVVAGSPNAEEMAAVTAVLTGVLEELAAEQGRRELAGPTAWQRSQRALRKPMTPGVGGWQAFGG